MRGAALALTLFLAGCAAPVVTACPSVPAYSAAFQARLAEEIRALSPESALGVAIIDYAQLRAQLRACATP